jgi:hypothetical protein
MKGGMEEVGRVEGKGKKECGERASEKMNEGEKGD